MPLPSAPSAAELEAKWQKEEEERLREEKEKQEEEERKKREEEEEIKVSTVEQLKLCKHPEAIYLLNKEFIMKFICQSSRRKVNVEICSNLLTLGLFVGY